jgi:Arc/MetJ-type ribon-helix-helix transcriptional regulator
MRKTSVYLTDEEVEGLRRMASATGRSQADLIRDGIRHMLASTGPGQRHFHSLGKGHGSGNLYTPWAPDDVYRKVMGRRV